MKKANTTEARNFDDQPNREDEAGDVSTKIQLVSN